MSNPLKNSKMVILTPNDANITPSREFPIKTHDLKSKNTSTSTKPNTSSKSYGNIKFCKNKKKIFLLKKKKFFFYLYLFLLFIVCYIKNCYFSIFKKSSWQWC